MYYLFIDESGDHGLSKIDEDYPVFLLCGVIIESTDYIEIDKNVQNFKRSIWGDKTVIFHSTDIRRKRKEFANLIDEKIYKEFLLGLNHIMHSSNYTVIASGVDKLKFIEAYGKIITNIYAVCLSFILERLVFYLDSTQDNDKNLQICIESRGKKEDTALKKDLDLVLSRGTRFVNRERFKALNIKIHFRKKNRNITGLQMSDLIAYPIARYIIDKNRANLAFDLIKDKLYSKNGRTYGLKVSP